jgi:hypothetical protein
MMAASTVAADSSGQLGITEVTRVGKGYGGTLWLENDCFHFYVYVYFLFIFFLTDVHAGE